MILESERLLLYPIGNEAMTRLIETEEEPEMKQAYSEMLEGCIREPENRIWYSVWNMELKAQPGTVIGDFCFKGLAADGTVELGYGLREEYRGCGYMTEAVRLISEWAAEQPGVRRVEAETDPANLASQKVLARAGYVPTGTVGEEGPRYIYMQKVREKAMRLETERLIITEFTRDMAQAVHENSLDEDNRRFVPDEVFETPEDALKTVEFLMGQYGGTDGPLVYPVILKATGDNIGYVQMVPLADDEWELGYHIAEKYTGRGYATEAVRTFLPFMAERLGLRKIYGICLRENAASLRVLEKCGFENEYTGPGEYQGEEREISENVWRV